MIRKISAVVIALAAVVGHAEAQQSRAELLRSATSAYDDFAPERALDLARAAVNPALGPTDSVWSRAVHLLTQIIVEGGNQDLARTWTRWAMRTSPGMPIDSVNFLAGVAAALRDARAFTAAQAPGDAVTRTTWAWVARGSSEANGRIAVIQGAIPVAVNVRIVGGALIPANGLSLSAGTYEIEAAAPGYLPARVTREVLPGVSTTLSFALTSAAVASDVIAEGVRRHTFANVAGLEVARFGSPPACAVGAFVGRDGLLVTSYGAIRGADNVSVLGSGAQSTRATIAAYDDATDLAVLHVPGARADSVTPAATIAEGQSAWGIALANCRTPSETRVRVTQWTGRPQGALQLSTAPTGAAVGSPLVDVEGRLSGVWTGGATAVPAPTVVALLQRARAAVTAGQQIAVADVSRRQNHAYGSVAIGADLPNTTLQIRPLEQWHWEALQTSGPAPLTLTGPMGRYRVTATAPGVQPREQDVTIRPGATDRMVITLRTVAQARTPAGASVRRRSKLPWILGGVVAAGAGAALALGGGGDKNPPGDTRGSIRIEVPNP